MIGVTFPALSLTMTTGTLKLAMPSTPRPWRRAWGGR